MNRPRNSTEDLTLLAWSDAIRAAKTTRRRRFRLLIAAALPAVPLLCTLAWHPSLRLVWNATPSAPVGLYAIINPANVRLGDTVIARLPKPLAAFAAKRQYLPENVPLVKKVAATRGDEVCSLGLTIFINGAPVAERRPRDGRNRGMPEWIGCQVLRTDQLFLLMPHSPASFDGRYFGISYSRDIIGKATPLWTR